MVNKVSAITAGVNVQAGLTGNAGKLRRGGRSVVVSVLTVASLLTAVGPMAGLAVAETGQATATAEIRGVSAVHQPGHYQLRILGQQDGITKFDMRFFAGERLEVDSGRLLIKSAVGELIEEVGTTIRTPQGAAVTGVFVLEGEGKFSFTESSRETPTRVKRGWPGWRGFICSAAATVAGGALGGILGGPIGAGAGIGYGLAASATCG